MKKDAQNKDLVDKLSEVAHVLKTPEAFVYDDDGNLISDGRFLYSWDAENRLIAVESCLLNPVKIKLEFAYDYQSRRISKKVYSWASTEWQLDKTILYIYDGWNLLAEIDGSGNIVNSYLWGEDLSGSLQGAGGVGGLVAVTTSTGTYYPSYDGNGNVMSYTDDTGAVVASYVYDPFGRTIQKDGALADALEFRFSTKFLDSEIELYNWTLRPYKTDTGMWLCRDIAEEKGGKNLYGFVSNNPIRRHDVLGMWGDDIHNDATARWALLDAKYPMKAATAIGIADKDIDYGATSPIWGDQSYHFNRPWRIGGDSRVDHYNDHFKKAKKACSDLGSVNVGDFGKIKISVNDFPETAARELGSALHPMQDIFAHGDFGRYTPTGRLMDWHNSNTPQKPIFGIFDILAKYPDNPQLDAVDGPSGIPSGEALYYYHSMGVDWEYAYFVKGSQRITATKQMTIDSLNAFFKLFKNTKEML